MHPDHPKYAPFMSRALIEKSVNTLSGLLQGISIDHTINATERRFLNQWIEEQVLVSNRYPFTEIIPRLTSSLSDGLLTTEEREDLMWLCDRLLAGPYFDQITIDLQHLQAIVSGIASDCLINEAELRGLSDWIMEHDHLKSMWPYDEIESLVTAVLADQRISEQEYEILQEFFEQFTPLFDNRTIDDPWIKKNGTLVGLCAVCPEIVFEDSVFCFTGSFSKHRRYELETLTLELGGLVAKNMSKKVNYLIIGSDGNPFWAYACYGRKVEQAVRLRKKGHHLQIIHENDFHDAVEDNRS